MRITVKLPTLSKTAHTTDTLKPGDIAPDGSIYLGYFKDFSWDEELGYGEYDKDWYVTATDVTGKVQGLHGHEDWVTPSSSQFRKMFNEKSTGAFKGTYNETPDDPRRWYQTDRVKDMYEEGFNMATGETWDFCDISESHLQRLFSRRYIRSVRRKASP